MAEGGHYALASGGQFTLVSGGQFEWFFQIKVFQSGFAMSTGGSPSIAVYLKRYEDLPKSQGNGLGQNYFTIMGYNRELPFKAIEDTTGLKVSKTYCWDPSLFVSQSSKFNPVTLHRSTLGLEMVLIIEGFTSEGDIIFHKEYIKL